MTVQPILIDSDSEHSDVERCRFVSSQPAQTKATFDNLLSSSQDRVRESSPESSLPSFHELFRRTTTARPNPRGTSVSGTFIDSTDASPARIAVSNRAGSLRRITSLPTKSPSQQNKATTGHYAPPIEIIDLGSDSIRASSDRGAHSDAEPSSPILTQFTLSRPAAKGQSGTAGARARSEALLRATADAERAGPSRVAQPIVLGSSPEPPRPAAATRPSSGRNGTSSKSGAAGQKTFRLASSPPPSSPLAEQAVDARPSAKPPPARSLPGSRSGSLQRKTSLLDALDALQTVQEALETSDDEPGGASGSGGRTTASPSARKRTKAQSSSPVKQRKRTRPGASAASARLFSSDTEQDATTGKGAAAAAAAATTTTVATAQKAKEAEREAKRLEREFKKAERERAAAEKKRWAEANKLRRGKGDTMKELIVEVDQRLCHGSPTEAILRACYDSMKERMERDGATVTTMRHEAAAEVPPMITFKRKVRARLDPVRRSWVPLDSEVIESEKVVIVVLDGKQVVNMVEQSSLLARIHAVRDRLASGYQLFVLVQGMHRHFSRLINSENRAYTARIRSALASETAAAANAPPAASTGVGTDGGGSAATAASSSSSSSSRRTVSAPAIAAASAETTAALQDKVEMALMRLQVSERCFLVHANGLVDLAEWICTLTGDISLRPYKVVRSSFLSFCAEGAVSGAGGGALGGPGSGGRNTTGQNEVETYRLMLMQIPRVTSHVSSSIMAVYPTLSSLYRAYAACKTQHEIDTLLSDCQVDTNVDGTLRAANRRGIGAGLSKRIAAVLMGQDPLALVGGLV
ncbi:uncharacterized protein PFL1_03030 [Pseudozyma flocculosa PF-1]|uniref:Uncharacterized protein n=1 Tax=Pseudozyma flocculosa PF-1 TaxID=1277687 RepID=A0A061HB65_9BASI|nr:uncharacterized protein PFL1_03030 [Pseudozyma flocculosa PF-1]EPQ29275.1 hypothetical protein PFL1_03030 [Pseudozyma flocculosa PF-1]